MEKRLQELRQITRMVLDVERMKLQRIAAKEKYITDRMKEMESQSSQRAKQLLTKGGSDLALFAGADPRWDSWKQQQKRTLNTQRAALLANRDVQRLSTEKAFGKDEAVRRLLENVNEETRVKIRRE